MVWGRLCVAVCWSVVLSSPRLAGPSLSQPLPCSPLPSLPRPSSLVGFFSLTISLTPGTSQHLHHATPLNTATPPPSLPQHALQLCHTTPLSSATPRPTTLPRLATPQHTALGEN
ncbi:hypothetical protein O3P69_012107 [Scylla paramamosain]|uniref:Secreted protein n=1 Tax=Scylla paramamosain TaxID=85552 RepID=A0AAW0TCI1_SCYPA